MIQVHIIAIETGGEPFAIRQAAEWWGAFVTATWVGNSGQIVDYLSGQPDHDVIIFVAHGDERGLLLPELAPEIVHRYPYNEVIRPEEFSQFVQLQNNTVISLACWGGMKELADAFIACGARYYIGPVDAPHGSTALMYALDFLYNYIHVAQDVEKAHQTASCHDDDRGLFTLYKAGRESQ